MPLLPCGEYKPDISDYEGSTSRNILSVFPRGDGYGPVPSFSGFSAALGSACRGAFYALKSDGSVVIFAATSTDLYALNNTDYTWTLVSKGGVSYSALNGTAQWRFAQFGNNVIAVQSNTVPQVFDLVSGTAFADLGGSPPQAAYIDIVGRFVVLSGLLTTPYRIQWSGLNAITTWTSGVNSSDFQDFPDGGIVRGVAGGEFGTIFQDQAIRRMSYIPGSPLIFQIERISQDKGLFAPYSIIRAGETVFFYAGQGFYKIPSGGLPEQIGRERIDRTFRDDLDRGNLQLFMGAADPRSSRVYWAYKSLSGNAALFDKVIGYDLALDKWFPVALSGDYLFGVSQSGLTLESLDTISSSIDALTLSLDAYATAVQPEIGLFNGSHVLGFLRGTPLEATIESAEQGTDGRKLFVRGFRPITDAATAFGSVSARATQAVPAVAGTEVAMNVRTGRCDMRKSTRYTRFKVRIPAGTAWTFIAGIEPDASPEGRL